MDRAIRAVGVGGSRFLIDHPDIQATLTFDRLALIVRCTSALANGDLLSLASQAFEDGGLVMRTIEEGADERAFKRVLFVAGTLTPTDRLIGFIVLPLLHVSLWAIGLR